MGGPVKTYYWNTRPNFGDLLTGLLLKKFTGLDSIWSDPTDAELVVVGSVLEKIPENWTGIVAGAGKLHEKTQLNLDQAVVLALRGPLTAKGMRGNFALGDPGLLADELVPLTEKEFDLGIIPHWTDHSLAADPRFIKYHPVIIDVRNDPLKVISDIGKCKKIISSSLHGIILADAFGIPRRIEISPRALSHAHQEGGLFKWRDYSLSLGMELQIGKTQEPDRNVVLERQYELFDVFEEIERIFS